MLETDRGELVDGSAVSHPRFLMPYSNQLSDRSLQVLSAVNQEALRIGHNFVGLELLLLGLLRTDNGAAQLLSAAGVSLESARAGVEHLIGRGSGCVNANPPFTPKAKQTVESAVKTAHEQEFPLVEPEHLLLALLDSLDAVSHVVLENLDTSIPQLREATLLQIQTLPRSPDPQPVLDSETETSLLPAIPPTERNAPKHLSVHTLPQESGRHVAEVSSWGNILHGPNFTSIGYGDTEFEAIAQALESLARMYRDYRA